MDALLAALERSRGWTPDRCAADGHDRDGGGPLHVDEIAAASPRTVCLGFGAGDFSLDVGLDWPPERAAQPDRDRRQGAAGAGLAQGRARPAARRRLPDFREPEQLRAEARAARALGFHGKHAIHPDQVPVILDVYGPSEADVAEARATLEAYERGLEDGIGGVHIDGRFIDYPVAERARRVLAESGEELPSPLPLEGLRVLDISSLYAAPLISANLGDFGATVIKVEHPAATTPGAGVSPRTACRCGGRRSRATSAWSSST